MCIQQGNAGRSLPLAMIQSLVAYLRQTRLLHCCTMAQIRKSTLPMMNTPVTMTAMMPMSQSATRAAPQPRCTPSLPSVTQLSAPQWGCIWLIKWKQRDQGGWSWCWQGNPPGSGCGDSTPRTQQLPTPWGENDGRRFPRYVVEDHADTVTRLIVAECNSLHRSSEAHGGHQLNWASF